MTIYKGLATVECQLLVLNWQLGMAKPKFYVTIEIQLWREYHVILTSWDIYRAIIIRLFNSHWHDWSTVTGMILQQWLAQFFNSRWHICSIVVGMIAQQSLARLFNSYWHNYSIVTGKILFSMLAEFFNSDVHCWRIVPCTRNTTHDPISRMKLKNENLSETV